MALHLAQVGLQGVAARERRLVGRAPSGPCASPGEVPSRSSSSIAGSSTTSPTTSTTSSSPDEPAPSPSSWSPRRPPARPPRPGRGAVAARPRLASAGCSRDWPARRRLPALRAGLPAEAAAWPWRDRRRAGLDRGRGGAVGPRGVGAPRAPPRRRLVLRARASSSAARSCSWPPRLLTPACSSTALPPPATSAALARGPAGGPPPAGPRGSRRLRRRDLRGGRVVLDGRAGRGFLRPAPCRAPSGPSSGRGTSSRR